jgi:hypothetical protein
MKKFLGSIWAEPNNRSEFEIEVSPRGLEP